MSVADESFAVRMDRPRRNSARSMTVAPLPRFGSVRSIESVESKRNAAEKCPHAAAVQEICRDLYTRFMVIACTQSAHDVHEVGVQLVAKLESYRNEAESTKEVEAAAADAPHLPLAQQDERESTYNKRMDDRMAELVERHDADSIVEVHF
jgi:hypothetical protein